MSLINQLLQDLDKRRSQPAEDVQLPQGTRATPVSARTGMRRPAIWSLAALGCALVAVLYVWQTRSPPALDSDEMMAAAQDHPAIPENYAVIPAITQAQVEATLMAPVFQLSNELASPPELSRVALNVDSAVTAPRKQRAKTPPPQRNGSASERTASVSEPVRQTQSEPEHTERRRPQATAKAATASNDDATSNAPVPRIAKAIKRPVALRSEALEETVIPADISVRPIAKQTRRLTSYERAEIEFRKGVANLRKGRLTDAEAFFRLANEEDRSHVAARQALVGILIELGRNADAE